MSISGLMVLDRNSKEIIMKGLIVEEMSRGYLTNMVDIFNAIDNKQREYNWLISYYECNLYPTEQIPLNNDYVWIDGNTLTEIVENNEIQFIWGVFSGFLKHISYEEVIKYPLPLADYEGLWSLEVKIQHPLAAVEIIPWDSSLVVIKSSNHSILNKFKRFYPNSLDLSSYNAN